QQNSLSANDLMAIAQDNAGAIWVGVYAGGLDRLEADGKGFAHFRHQDGKSALRATASMRRPARDCSVSMRVDRRRGSGRYAKRWPACATTTAAYGSRSAADSITWAPTAPAVSNNRRPA